MSEPSALRQSARDASEMLATTLEANFNDLDARRCSLGASPVFVGSRFSSRVPGGFVPSQFAASSVVAPVAAVARTAN